MKPGPGFYNPNYSFLLKKIPAAKIAEIILKPSDLNPPLEKIRFYFKYKKRNLKFF